MALYITPIKTNNLSNEKKKRIQKDFKGLTGKIKFDQEGFRTDVELELVDLTQNGLRVTGTWNAKTGINVSTSVVSETKTVEQEFDLRNMSFVVITALVSKITLRHRSVLLANSVHICVVISADATIRHDETFQQHVRG